MNRRAIGSGEGEVQGKREEMMIICRCSGVLAGC